MTYFGFLIWFLIIPILLLLAMTIVDRRLGRRLPLAIHAWSATGTILLHVIIAVLYTTLWDNYLVANNVWWYDPALVNGLTIGYVPIEEYTFFVLQPILAGLWLLFLLRRMPLAPSLGARPSIRWFSVAITAILWVPSALVLLAGWAPGTYLALILVWALPPIALQLAFGADILWRHRRLLTLAIVPTTLFLSFADILAIGYWGIWTIDPQQSLNIFLAGILPIEEFIFFLMTNTLLVFGVTLVLAQASHARFNHIRSWLQQYLPSPRTLREQAK
jgi:lycopene cyclase domain-containing protein